MNPSDSQVANANKVLEAAYVRIRNEVGHAFGSDMDLNTTHRVVDSTVAHRFLNKFEEPDQHARKAKRSACFQKWLDIDTELGNISLRTLPFDVKSQLYRARELVHKWCSGFRPADDRIDFTPGEGFIASRGYTSIIRKLAVRSHWTVTHDAFDEFAALVYNTSGLKRSARRLMKPLTAESSLRLMSITGSPFEAFKYRLEHDVCTLVHGGRLSSVYKNAESERPIDVQALGNMLLQRTVAHPLREILRCVGNDLQTGQSLHQIRISDSVSTIDFSGCSDRISLEVVKMLFPASVHKLLQRYRSPMTLVDGIYYLPKKLSSMGCGFTFEVMTMLLLAIARVSDASATVYGDDVIIDNSAASAFVRCTEAIGLEVNMKKTFIAKPFRESCGKYYLEGYGYITCYDIRWCHSWRDVTLCANKLQRIIADYRCEAESPLLQILHEAHKSLLDLAPPMFRGPVCSELDTGFIQDPDFDMRSQKGDRDCRKTRAHVKGLIQSFCLDHHYDVRKTSVARVPVFRSKTGWATLSRDGLFLDQGPKYLASLLAGRVAQDTIRNQGQWVWKLVICHPDFGWRFVRPNEREEGQPSSQLS